MGEKKDKKEKKPEKEEKPKTPKEDKAKRDAQIKKAKDRTSSAGSHKSRHSSTGSKKRGSKRGSERPSMVSDFTSAHGSEGSASIKHSKGSTGIKNAGMIRSSDERHEIGSALFQEQAEELRWKGLAGTEQPGEERHRTKTESQDQLDVVVSICSQGLKMCGSEGSLYLLGQIVDAAEKLKAYMDEDKNFQEEVRFKHCKMHDLCDETRDYGAPSLQKDLVRNREIRNKCSELIRGGRPEKYVVDQDEMDELIRVRNSIRTWYGGQNNLKGKSYEQKSGRDMNIFEMRPSDVKISSNYQGLQSDFVQADEGPLAAGAAQD